MEKFISYGAHFKVKDSTDVNNVIVPISGSGNRTANASTQVHSFYVAQANDEHHATTGLEADANFFSIGVSDGTNTYLICNDVPLIPQSSYYIEKTISLLPTQYMFIKFKANAGKNSTDNYYIDVFASTVDLV